ncbi:MAG: hypothetical protein FWE80_00690 [Oscillospiraceae bacterium]|nr:hypothetical protein [Oscillospiraceae bacterium]
MSLAKELPYKDYTELLDALREHVEAVIQQPDIEMENDFFLEWALREPFMSCGEDYSEVRDKLGYALKDLNQNGKLDLILLNKEYFTVVAIITLVEDKPYLLNEYWSRHSCVIYDSGVIYSNSHAGAGDLDYMTQRISPDGSGFIQEVKFGATTTNDFGWYKEIDGIQYAIEQSEFDEFQKEYPHLSYPEAEEITKSAGLEFIPLFG